MTGNIVHAPDGTLLGPHRMTGLVSRESWGRASLPGIIYGRAGSRGGGCVLFRRPKASRAGSASGPRGVRVNTVDHCVRPSARRPAGPRRWPGWRGPARSRGSARGRAPGRRGRRAGRRNGARSVGRARAGIQCLVAPHPPPSYYGVRNLRYTSAGPLRSRGRLPRLHRASKRGALPAGPTERDGPPPLSNSPGGLCGLFWTVAQILDRIVR